MHPEPLDPPQRAASACCELQKIAHRGSQNIVTNNVVTPNPNPTPAFFADTPGALQKALSDILANIAKNATTRTVPAYAASTPGDLRRSEQPDDGRLAVPGVVQPVARQAADGRHRAVARRLPAGDGRTYSVTQQTPDPTAGDDFGANLNSNAGNTRTFIAFQPDPKSDGSVDPTATIRPYVATTVGDGLGQYQREDVRRPGDQRASRTSRRRRSGIPAPCPYSSSATSVPVTPGLTTAQCATMTLDYTFGQQTFTSNPGNFPFVSRYGQALGGIYHASPAIVGPPSTLLQDPGYSGFQGTWQSRKGVAYVATTDGLLHAFWTDETKLENNELWAMLLPARDGERSIRRTPRAPTSCSTERLS